ncbi:hypothetical protein TWF281_009433 [Arthrobotrys megalospora]
MDPTCPVVPSFAGIRHGPPAGKRAMPARRAMPKARQSSTSAASAAPKTPVTPITPKEEGSRPNLTISVPPVSTSSQRDDGPEEGEISDDEDDHYSPREATTPVQIPSQLLPLTNPFQQALVASMQPPMMNPFSVNNINGNQNDQLTRREQQNTNTLRETHPTMMPMPELRKAAQSAVMYLACSAKMSFEEIVAEGVERRVLAGIYNHLKLPMPDSSKNVPTTVLPKNTTAPPPPEVPNGLKATAPTPTVQQPLTYPKPENVAIPSPVPTSLPPKPPISVSTTNNNTPKPESVVSRFNQSIPGLNVVQPSPSGIISPPLPTPQPDTVQEISPTSQPPTLRGRKRPVAADFDTEIKPALLNSKQPRFGNRQHLEASQLIFEVSDNEEEDREQKTLRVTPQAVGPSRPDSTNPEKNEKLEESLRLKELEIERMRQKIMAMSRKRKLANNETGSGPSSKPTTPLPVTPSADLLTAKESSLEKVEEFLHQTLDQISTGAVQPAAVEAAVEIAEAELMDVEAKVDGLNVDAVINTPPSINSPEKDPTPAIIDSEAKDTLEGNLNSDNSTMVNSSSELQDGSERRSSDDKSFATAPIDMDSGDDDADAPGSPMELSDLETTSDGSDEDSESDSESDLGAEDSESNDTSEQVSSDDSADVEMEDTSGNRSPASDSASSPVQEPLDDDDDGYDPEARKSTIGEVSLPPTSTEIPQTQPPLIIGASEPQQGTITSTKNQQQPKEPESGFTPYQSQLTGFRSFRYHPNYNQLVSQGFKSLTYSNHIDSELPICDFETRGGTCNDPQCRWQHFRQMAIPGALYKSVRRTCYDTTPPRSYT